MTSSPTPALLPDARARLAIVAEGGSVVSVYGVDLDMAAEMRRDLAVVLTTPPASDAAVPAGAALTIPSGCKITQLSPTIAMIEAAERQGYTAYSAREVWISMHAEAPHIRAYGVEREGVCGCILGSEGEPLGGACESCSAKLNAFPATPPVSDAAKALFDHEMRERGVVASWDDVEEDDRAGWQLSADIVLAAAAPKVASDIVSSETLIAEHNAQVDAGTLDPDPRHDSNHPLHDIVCGWCGKVHHTKVASDTGAGFVLMPRIATREMVDAADACTDAYSAYAAMVEVGHVR